MHFTIALKTTAQPEVFWEEDNLKCQFQTIISYHKSSKICTVWTQESFVLLSLHTMQYLSLKYSEAHAKCNNRKLIAGYQYLRKLNKALLWADSTECGHKRIPVHEAPRSAFQCKIKKAPL